MAMKSKVIRTYLADNPTKVWIGTVLIGFFILVVTSITNSSVAYLNYSGVKPEPGVILGAPNPIRSDEYVRWSPQFIADTKFGKSVSLMDYQSSTEYELVDSSIPKKLIELSNLDFQVKSAIEKLLPIEMAFAFDWWFYVALALIFLPLLINLFGPPLSIAIPATLLIFFSPSNQWWSNGQIQIFGIAAPAFYFFIAGFLESSFKNKVTTKGFSFFVISSIFLAQLPFQYQPWSIPISIFVGVMALSVVFFNFENKKYLIKILSLYLIASLILILTRILVERDSFELLANTVYPGQRRIEIEPVNYSVLSSVLTLQLRLLSAPVKFGNSSEAAISFFEIGLLLVFLLPIFFYFRKLNTSAKVLVVSTGTLGVFSLWVYGVWPDSLLMGNLLTFVSQDRLAQLIGNLALLALPIAMYTFWNFPKSNRKKTEFYLLFTLGIAFYLSNQDISNPGNVFRIQPYELGQIRIALIIYFLILGLFFVSKKIGTIAIWIAIIFAGLLAQVINPIQHGTGDLLNSDLAKQIQQIELTDSGTWASNSRELDAVLIANVNNMLSGQQPNGPNNNSWRKFDPEESQNSVWNRASSFVIMNWISDESIGIENPANDVIQININPCNSVLADFNLKWILSNSELNYSCLTQTSSIENQDGISYLIYRRN